MIRAVLPDWHLDPDYTYRVNPDPLHGEARVAITMDKSIRCRLLDPEEMGHQVFQFPRPHLPHEIHSVQSSASDGEIYRSQHDPNIYLDMWKVDFQLRKFVLK